MRLRGWTIAIVGVILLASITWGMYYYDLNYSDGLYQPLQVATARGDMERIRYLVETKGFGVSKYTLGIAVTYDRMESLRVFIEELGIDVDKPGISNETVLMHAAEELRPRFVEYLLAQGADPNAEDKGGERALYSAVKSTIQDYYPNPERDRADQLEIVRMLVEAGADIDADGGAVLDQAVVNDDFTLAEYLLRSGADPNAASNGERGALMLSKSREMAELLLAHGADLNRTDDQGESVIQHVLEFAKNTEIVEYLLKRGVDLCHRDHKGRSLWDSVEPTNPIIRKSDETIRELEQLLLDFQHRKGLDCGWSVPSEDQNGDIHKSRQAKAVWRGHVATNIRAIGP